MIQVGNIVEGIDQLIGMGYDKIIVFARTNTFHRIVKENTEGLGLPTTKQVIAGQPFVQVRDQMPGPVVVEARDIAHFPIKRLYWDEGQWKEAAIGTPV